MEGAQLGSYYPTAVFMHDQVHGEAHSTGEGGLKSLVTRSKQNIFCAKIHERKPWDLIALQQRIKKNEG